MPEILRVTMFKDATARLDWGPASDVDEETLNEALLNAHAVLSRVFLDSQETATSYADDKST